MASQVLWDGLWSFGSGIRAWGLSVLRLFREYGFGAWGGDTIDF